MWLKTTTFCLGIGIASSAGAQCDPDELAKLTSYEVFWDDRFGTAVAQGEGLLLVGTPNVNDGGTDTGRAEITRPHRFHHDGHCGDQEPQSICGERHLFQP